MTDHYPHDFQFEPGDFVTYDGGDILYQIVHAYKNPADQDRFRLESKNLILSSADPERMRLIEKRVVETSSR